MDVQSDRGLVLYFMDLPDPRGENAIHILTDMFVIAICAVICGADCWVDVQLFGIAKKAFFKTFLRLPGGIPSHDTFSRVFSRIDPDEFEKCFNAWVSSLAQSNGKLIAIDGKSIRRSFEHGWDKSGMTHLINAFVAENQMIFAQLATDKTSNEITAIPKLLELLDLRDATVTIDAIACQKNIAQAISDKQAHYILALKGNQPDLHSQVQSALDEAIASGFSNMPHDYHEQTNGGHGRLESRQTWITTDIAWLGERLKEWPSLAALMVVKATRTLNGKTSVSHRYYISSNAKMTAKQAAEAIRGHWKIENQVHWILDVAFNEDQRRMRKDHGAENFSRLGRIALNLLKTEKTKKVGIKAKRKLAGWDHSYLLTLLLK